MLLNDSCYDHTWIGRRSMSLLFCDFFFSVNAISEAQLVSSAGQNANTFPVYIDIKKEGSCVL